MPETMILAETWTLAATLVSMWYFFLVIVGFCVIIFVHELGHFIMAKIVGVRVEVFAIGFGPRLCGFKRGDTDYCLRAVPFGGYVKMLGQEDAAIDQERVLQTKDDPRSFLAKPVGHRMLIVSGGVVMNIVFAILAFVVVFMHGLKRESPIIGPVIPDSAAEKAGIQPGDIIRTINGSSVMHWGEVKVAIMLNAPKQPIDMELERGGKIVRSHVRPIWNERDQALMIGIVMGQRPKIMNPGLGSFTGKELKEDDNILKAGAIKPKFFYQVEDALYKARGKPVELLVERMEDNQIRRLTVQKRAHLIIRPRRTPGVEQAESAEPAPESVLGLMPRCSM